MTRDAERAAVQDKATADTLADQLGTCDGCAFSPFAADTSASRDLAFARIEARVKGTAMAAEALGV